MIPKPSTLDEEVLKEAQRQASQYVKECGAIGHYQETAIVAAYMAGYCNALEPKAL